LTYKTGTVSLENPHRIAPILDLRNRKIKTKKNARRGQKAGTEPKLRKTFQSRSFASKNEFTRYEDSGASPPLAVFIGTFCAI
jgi:hypothetical protein